MSLVFEREKAASIVDPTAAQIVRELRKLRSYGPSSFASLTRSGVAFVQVAGGGAGCMLERRDLGSGKIFRAWQEPPVVPFDDGTVLSFTGGEVRLNKGEWFRIDQVIEVFTAFNRDEPLPEYIRWRDVTDILEK